MQPLADAVEYAEKALDHLRSAHAGFPSLAVALVAGQASAFVCRGAQADTEGRPADPTTLYALASCLKPMTAAAVVAAIAAAGPVSAAQALASPLARWLPHADQGLDAPATLHGLLAHRLEPWGPAGLAGNGYLLDGGEDPSVLTKELGSFPPDAELATTRFHPTTRYQNAAYSLAGYLLTLADGPPAPPQPRPWALYEDAMRRRVWDPLGMSSTGIVLDEAALPRVAAPFAWTTLAGARNRARLVRKQFLRMAATSAAEAWSTAEDLARFARLAAGGLAGAIETEPLRRAVETLVGASSAGVLADDVREAGPGWMLHPDRPGERWHRGDKLGYQAVLGVAPDHGCAIALLCNVHGEDEHRQRGLGALGMTIHRLGLALMDALAHGRCTRLDAVLAPRLRDPLPRPFARRRAPDGREWDLAFPAERDDVIVVLRSGAREAVHAAVAPGPGSPAAWLDRLNAAPDGGGWQVYHPALPPGFEPDAPHGGAAALLSGRWVGSVVRPWWWSTLELTLGAEAPDGAQVRVAGRRVMELDHCALGLARGPGDPPDAPARPALHAEGPAPDRGGYGFIDLAGDAAALLGDWVIEGERYHVALRRPDPARPRWWPPLATGTWNGRWGEGPGARPLRLRVAALGQGRRRQGSLSLGDEAGSRPLAAFVALNGALRFEDAPHDRRLLGWGGFVGDLCQGTLRVEGRAERFWLRRDPGAPA